MHLMMLSYNKFPEGDAGAIREYSLALLAKSLDNEITIVGMGASNPYKINEYNGIPYYSLRLKGSTLITKFKNYFGYSKRLRTILNEYEDKLDIILVVDIPINALIMVKKIAKHKGIKLIHDSVEWYSPEQFKLKWFSPAYIIKNLYNKLLIDENFRVIAISRYLEDHFTSRQILVEKIPVILPIEEIPCVKAIETDKFKLLYAGSPGKKDYLANMLRGIASIDDNSLARIEFHIFGVSEDQLENILEKEEFDKIKRSIFIYGRVSRDIVLKQLLQSHFSVMLRNPEARYSKAGFPTKIVESLATGTPVITNLSSDLGNYLKDEVNSIIVDDCSSEAFKKAVLRAINVSDPKLHQMFHESRKTAIDFFDIEKYKENFNKIIHKK
jgi:glycosyltransferase involved in cell wall biosynthesis